MPITWAVENDIPPSRMPIRAKELRGALVTPHAAQQESLGHVPHGSYTQHEYAKIF
jgi:hypothetical protein